MPLLEDAVPVVMVRGGKILHDQEVVGDASALAAGGRLQRVDGLWQSLKDARDRWKAAHSGARFHGVALFAFDATTPAIVVKSVFQTAAFAGYPNGQLAVRGVDKTVKRLNVDAIVPLPPPAGREIASGARLLVGIRPSKVSVAWRNEGSAPAGAELGSVAELGERVARDWTARGVHRDGNDKAFDQAIVYVANEIDYAGIVATVDALYATKRDFAFEGRTERVPALNVSLAMPEEMSASGDPLRAAFIGRLPPEVIQRIVREGFDGMRHCYEKALAKNAALEGKVQIRFVIDKDGKVAEVADAGGSTLNDASAVACILHEFGRLTFPPPEGGVVTVVYPLVFRASGEP